MQKLFVYVLHVQKPVVYVPHVLLALFVLLVPYVARASAQQVDPRLRFRVLETEHFHIYFHQGEDALAARLAAVAEETRRTLADSLGRDAPARVHVILVDQTDVSNGWATPIPRDTIAIYATAPPGSDALRADDWLRVVFTHEYTHILHLDRSRGWARVVRNVFGRAPFAFPNVYLPGWQIEGLAVHEESRITGDGRRHAGNFLAIVDEAARVDRFLPVDRASGGLSSWPSGHAEYAYGLGFHSYLAERYGVHTLTELADRTASALPYFGPLAFRRVYGKSLGDLWREYEQAATASAGAAAAPPGERLSHHEFIVAAPRFAPAACAACEPDLYYSVRDADELPSLYRLRGGTPAARPERVTRRMFGSTVGPGRARLYFDQQETRRNAGLYSDLYAFDPVAARVRALTREARLVDPDLSPDQQTIVAARNSGGTRELVLVRLASPDAVAAIETLVREDDAQFNAPRWSPDGRTIAAERQRRGAPAEIVLVDVGAQTIRVLASESATRWGMPAWRPDGRAVIAARAAGDAPFNLFEIDLASSAARPLTHTTGGATWPVVSPDGRSIVYVAQLASGYDLFRMPYDGGPQDPGTPGPDPRTSGPDLRPPGPDRRTSGPPDLRTTRAYSPWPTLAPTSWSPVIYESNGSWRVGAGVAGADVLGYHRYAASIATAIDPPSNAPAAGLDWSASYIYGRWRPALFAGASRESEFGRVLVNDSDEPVEATRIARETEVGIAVPVVRLASRHFAQASFLFGSSTISTTRITQSRDRGAVRLAWATSSANQVGLSISQERGVAVSATTEIVRRGLGSSGDATTTTVDGRAYLPGLRAHHVVAVRAAAGVTGGSPLVGRVFLLGGASSDAAPIDFGSSAISLLRGFESRRFAGTRVGVVNIDYRFPVRRAERGWGALPVFLHTVHGAVFADVGHAWTRGFTASHVKTSFGAELAARLVLGYYLQISVATGVARGHDGAGRAPDQTTWFARAGYAF